MLVSKWLVRVPCPFNPVALNICQSSLLLNRRLAPSSSDNLFKNIVRHSMCHPGEICLQCNTSQFITRWTTEAAKTGRDWLILQRCYPNSIYLCTLCISHALRNRMLCWSSRDHTLSASRTSSYLPVARYTRSSAVRQSVKGFRMVHQARG